MGGLLGPARVQVAACPEVTVVHVEDVPAELLERERAIEMQKEDILSKPEAIRWVAGEGGRVLRC